MKTIATNHFQTSEEAIFYYDRYGIKIDKVCDRIASGEIIIGEPQEIDGCLLYCSEGRYFFEKKSCNE